MQMRLWEREKLGKIIQPKMGLQRVKKKSCPSTILKTLWFINQDYESYEQGYDSDGELPQFAEYVEKGEDPDNFSEDAINSLVANLSMEDVLQQPQLQPQLEPRPSTECLMVNQIMEITNAEFKDALELRGKPKSGKKKNVFQQRLIAAINDPVSKSAVQRDECINRLDVTARWVLLQHDPTPIWCSSMTTHWVRRWDRPQIQVQQEVFESRSREPQRIWNTSTIPRSWNRNLLGARRIAINPWAQLRMQETSTFLQERGVVQIAISSRHTSWMRRAIQFNGLMQFFH